MAAVASRSAIESAIGFFRRSFNLMRTMRTSAAQYPASAAAADVADADKPKWRKKKNLLEVSQLLPHWGIVYKMAKSHWRDVSYEITKTNLYKDGGHGKAWGIRQKAGIAVAHAPVKTSGVHKRGWKYIHESKKTKDENSSITIRDYKWAHTRVNAGLTLLLYVCVAHT